MKPEQVPNMMVEELVDTPISIVYQPGKQAAVPNILSHSPILHNSMDECAYFQPSTVG